MTGHSTVRTQKVRQYGKLVLFEVCCFLLLSSISIPSLFALQMDLQGLDDLQLQCTVSTENNDPGLDRNFRLMSPLISQQSRKYAIIIVGRYGGLIRDMTSENLQQYYGWYLNAAAMLYTILLETYQYEEEHIYLFTSLRDSLEEPAIFNEQWIDYPTSKTQIHALFTEFKPGGTIWLTNNDSLLVCFINHGSDDDRTDGEGASNTFFSLPYRFQSMKDMVTYFLFPMRNDSFRLYDWELAEYIENINAKRLIFLLQPCHSGGFINELSGVNHIICTSCRENELGMQSWIEPFIQGLSGQADGNGDLKISVLEAYEYAARKVLEHTTIEHPLLDDNDDGIGHHFSEGGYNPFTPNYDGYLAARTYL